MIAIAVLFARSDSVSVDRLRELFSFDPESGVVTRRIRVSNGAAGAAVGTPNKRGHMVVSVDRRLLYVHRIAWALFTGAWPSGEVDHQDADPANNRWSNLRDVTHALNVQNRRRPNVRHIGQRLLGVFREGNRFASKISAGGRIHRLGSFPTPEEAHAAYVIAKRRLHEGCTL
jgi:HNH endonuclease